MEKIKLTTYLTLNKIMEENFMFKKNKKKNLTVLVASIICMSAISFASVSAMEGNGKIYNPSSNDNNINSINVESDASSQQMRVDIRNNYNNVINNNDYGSYDKLKRAAEDLDVVMNKYIEIMEKQMKEENLQYDENAGDVRDARKFPLEGTLKEIINILKKYNQIHNTYKTKMKILENNPLVERSNNLREMALRYYDSSDSNALFVSMNKMHDDFSEFMGALKRYVKFVYIDNDRIDENRTKDCLEHMDNIIGKYKAEIKLIDLDYYEKNTELEKKCFDELQEKIFTIYNMKTTDFNKLQNKLTSYIRSK